MDRRSALVTRVYSRAKKSAALRKQALWAANALRLLALTGRRVMHPWYRPPIEGEPILDYRAWLEYDAGEGRVWEGRPGETVANRVACSVDHVYDEQYSPLEARIPPSVVLELHEGRVVGDGVVIEVGGGMLQQFSKPIGSMKSYMTGASDRETGHTDGRRHMRFPPRRLRGTAVVLSTFAGRGYYHWLFDVLARLATLDDAGLAGEPRYFIVNNYSAGYQIETLTRLGIDRRRVVTSFRNPHVVADRLLVPSLAREAGVTSSRTCQYIRDAFPKEELPEELAGATRLYVSRAGTDHGRLPAEAALVSALQKRRFTPVLLESLSMGQKATLFAQAEAVVGASGSGLTNLVFCEPGAVVVDICTRGYALLDAWDIANRLGVDYWYSVDRFESVMATLDGAGIR